MSDDQTYYEVLGIARGARKDEVRDAYRERLDAAQAERQRLQASKRVDSGALDAARNDEARVREAWQVLSDPYQRGRYDQRLEGGAGGGVVAGVGGVDGAAGNGDDPDDAEVVDDDRTPARRGGAGRGGPGGRAGTDRPRPQTMMSPDPVDPPPSWPPGLRPPPNRARSMAMFIDIFVLFVLLNVGTILGTNIIESKYPNKTDRIEQLSDDVTHFKDRQEHFGDIADDTPNKVIVQRGSNKVCPQDAPGADATAKKLAACFENKYDKVREERQDLVGDLQPARFAVLAATFLAMLAYLVPASAISGRTLGKRLLWVRLVRDDGTPAGLRGSLVHYGLPLFVALLLNVLFEAILPSIGFLIVLLFVASWPRNPNKQGMHDRIAHTLVVDG